jgi:uncharacterized protein with von Willebrand factor type A (vWA) domain
VNKSWRYSRFDGSGDAGELDAGALLDQLSNDLLYHGDLAAALRRLLQEGFDRPSGERVEGLRQMMERLQARREQLASASNDLEQRVAAALEEILATERAELEQQLSTANADPANAEAEADRREAGERLAELELLPSGLAGQIQGLMEYGFASQVAAERFEALLDELRSELVQNQLDRAAGQMANATDEERAHLRSGLDALNRMLEQRAEGVDLDPDFPSFMDEYGDLFPGNPANLDELLDQLGQRMAAASALMASMSPGQRAQLEQMSAQLMSDMDLSWQLDRLGQNLRDALPELRWDEQLGSAAGDPLSVLGATDSISQLAELNALEQLLSEVTEPGALAELDPERVAELLGKDVAEQMRALSELTRRLEEAGLVGRKDGRLSLTPSGLRRLGQNALGELFSRLRHDRFGNHQVPSPGLGHDRATETKPYEHGDPFRLDVEKTLRNAIARNAAQARDEDTGIGLPLRLSPDDFEIERSEHLTTASTVLAIDLSLSMPMENNFLAAKKVAMALQALIASKYPRDYLGLIGFSATAREIRADELPEVSWDFAYGTNLQHALALSRKMLHGKLGSRQIIVITDGEPTAHILDDGDVFFNYPAARETIAETMREVARCTREHIVINTFVLNSTGALRSFVERMTQLNKGRAFYTTPESLGDYLLIDFVEHRSAGHLRRVRPGA